MRRAALAAALLVAACALEHGDPLAPLSGEAVEAPAAESTAEAAEADSDEPAAADRADRAAAASPGPVAADSPEATTAEFPRAAAPADVPHIYMALQEDRGGPTSVILAIDRSRDGSPSDDPAIRITPENGRCNPQQLRYYNFPPERTQRPVYGPEEAGFGVTARELPDYMATTVSSEMMAAGLARDLEESRPQNVCTRKLLQRIIIDRSTGQG